MGDEVMTESYLWVKVSDKYRIAKDSVAIELVAEEGTDLPRFTAGAHIDIDLGLGVVRQYSLANDPGETHRYLLGVLKVPLGRGTSVALHDSLRRGDSIQISRPKNLFPLNEQAALTVLIGGGIGITPMLAFAHRLHSLGRPFELHFCARSRDYAPFEAELGALPFYSQLQLHLDDDPDSAMSLSGQLAATPENTHLYLCGPKGFMEVVLTTARNYLAEDQIHHESFDAVDAAPIMPTANNPFEVEIRSSGEILQVAADQTLVEVLQYNGLPVQRNCPRGFCGGCAVTVLEGEVEHRDSSLPDHLRNELGRMLSCVSRAKSARLVLDL
tara:strand:- start:2019 stop:3002 length:984 start_codon:yes stop_codon:yes gene_type:complete